MRVLFRFALFAALLWCAGFVWFMLTLPGPASAEIETDGIVVLTGGPGRLARGVELLAQQKAERMLISGVDAQVRPVELAVELGVPVELFRCCIDLGKQAADTRGNGAEVAEWVRLHDYRSIRLITAQDHMARAEAETRARLDPGVEIVADAVPGKEGRRALALEYSKYALRRAALALGLA